MSFEICGHLLRCYEKINPQRIKDTPAVNFFLCLVLASPIFKKAYSKKQMAQYIDTNCGSALIYKPTYPLKRLRRNVQVCTPFEAFSLTFENSRAAEKGTGRTFFSGVLRGMPKVCNADFGRRVLGSSPKTSHDWNQRRTGSSPKTNRTSLHRKLEAQECTGRTFLNRVLRGVSP